MLYYCYYYYYFYYYYYYSYVTDTKPGTFWSNQKPQRRHTIIPSRTLTKQSDQSGRSRIVSADATHRMTAVRIIANIARSHDSCSDDGRSSGMKSSKCATLSGRIHTALADQQPIGQTSYYDRVVSSESQSQGRTTTYDVRRYSIKGGWPIFIPSLVASILAAAHSLHRSHPTLAPFFMLLTIIMHFFVLGKMKDN